VPGEQKGCSVKNCSGDQEESFYNSVASSLKNMVGLNVSLEKLQVMGQDAELSQDEAGASSSSGCNPRLGRLQAGLSFCLSVLYGCGAASVSRSVG